MEKENDINEKDLMERVYFQIKMNPEHHSQLKFRSKQLSMPIGELVENLVSSLEVRLEEAYRVADIQKGLIDDLMLRILIKQEFSLPKEELLKKLDVEKQLTSTTTSKTTNAEFFKTTITV